MSRQTAENIARQGIDYLICSQRANGSFVIACNNPVGAVIPPAVNLGIHALLLDILSSLRNPELQTVIDGIATYLTHSTAPLLNNKAKESDSYSLFYSLSVLYEYDSTILRPEVIAAAVQLLIDLEQTPGGPYYNALDARTIAPDWLTNVSISRFIHQLGGPFPKLAAFLEESSVDFSRYYTVSWPLEFSCAALKPNGTWRQAAQATPPFADGSWQIEYTHKDPASTSGLLYGSSSLSVALGLKSSLKPAPAQTIQDHYSQLTVNAYADIAKLDPLIGDILKTRLTRLIAADTNYEIGPLAERFATSLSVPQRPEPGTLQTLGLANLYNWLAYTIYDDFLDDEGDPHLLSAANVALRKAVDLFCKAVPDEAFKNLVLQTFDAIDIANTWEINYCRFVVDEDVLSVQTLPDYTNLRCLHDRSLSHGLPIIGTLLAAGMPAGSVEVTTLTEVVKQYLVIRQLNDDLCDWKDDLRNGHISYVVAQVLKDAKTPLRKTPLKTLLPRLEQTFWNDSLAHIDALLQSQATKAQQSLASCTMIAQDNILAQLIDSLASVATRMRAEHQQTDNFLEAFQAKQ